MSIAAHPKWEGSLLHYVQAQGQHSRMARSSRARQPPCSPWQRHLVRQRLPPRGRRQPRHPGRWISYPALHSIHARAMLHGMLQQRLHERHLSLLRCTKISRQGIDWTSAMWHEET